MNKDISNFVWNNFYRVSDTFLGIHTIDRVPFHYIDMNSQEIADYKNIDLTLSVTLFIWLKNVFVFIATSTYASINSDHCG